MKDTAKSGRINGTEAVYKEVVIIGNGPAGLTLSYILSGRQPFYNGKAHPDPMLQARLQSVGSEVSLLSSDLTFLAQGLEGRSGNVMAVLFDRLLHPGVDQGLDYPSVVDWRYQKAVDHVVIGKGPPGGVWQAMDGNILTLSLSSWMELPGLSFSDWETDGPTEAGARRVRVETVAKYYTDYVHRMRLCRYQKRGEVTSIRFCDGDLGSGDRNWKVEGRDSHGRPINYICKRLVLATGSTDVPNVLGVPGEDLPWVHHDLKSLEAALEALAERKESEKGVLIVGAGLSAADAVLSARFRDFRVHHAFRNSISALERILPESMYPEYHKVYQMMACGGDGYPGYSWLGGRSVAEFSKNSVRLVDSQGKDSVSLENISLAAVLVGARPNLSFLPPEFHNGRSLTADPEKDVDPRSNPICTEATTHRAVKAGEGRFLYALGPLSGDNFVRFIVGGAAAVASDVLYTDS